jgi:hypothetical protein
MGDSTVRLLLIIIMVCVAILLIFAVINALG